MGQGRLPANRVQIWSGGIVYAAASEYERILPEEKEGLVIYSAAKDAKGR